MSEPPPGHTIVIPIKFRVEGKGTFTPPPGYKKDDAEPEKDSDKEVKPD